jgi:Domain of unknown function (DUF6285)
MIDRPVGPELLSAVRKFLESELIPVQSDARLRFQTLVAANVLAIAEREWNHQEDLLLQDCEWLRRWLLPDEIEPGELEKFVQELCQRIRDGEFDDPERFAALAADVRRSVERKLEIANPRYLAAFREA